MKYRTLGKTGLSISEVSLGTWQVGGKWGSSFDFENAERILNSAIDAGINFIDTADVYGDGLSEQAVGKVVKARKEEIYIATKCGRKINPHVNEGYTPDALEKYVDDSLKNIGVDTLDLVQLHCPPTEVYYRPEIFERFEKLRQKGKIKNLGVSVEKVEEAIKAIEYDNVTTVQIIFNIFRQRPADLFFSMAAARDVGIIVRVPLASGLLTGKFGPETEFEVGDHRQFNRHGEVFDRGETFSGIDYDKGLVAVGQIRDIFPSVSNLAPYALKWVLSFKEVSCVIPGASKLEHVHSNLKALEVPELEKQQMLDIEDIYRQHIRPQVHHYW